MFWLIMGIVALVLTVLHLIGLQWLYNRISEDISEKISEKIKKQNENEKQEKSEVQHLDPGFLLDDNKRKSFTGSAIAVKLEAQSLGFLLDDRKH
ncbi:hypothetical protein R83H12_01604 [Fibrobacteria bacterium R8-3-H12]